MIASKRFAVLATLAAASSCAFSRDDAAPCASDAPPTGPSAPGATTESSESPDEEEAIVIHVRARESGTDLASVLGWLEGWNGPAKWPGRPDGDSGRAPLKLGASPVRVAAGEPALQGVQKLLIGASGREWVELDLAHRREHFVELAMVGSLEVVIASGMPPQGLSISVRRKGRDLNRSWGIGFHEGDRALFEELPEGEYEIEAAAGSVPSGPTLATATMAVLAGARTTLDLVLQAPQNVALARLAGTVHVPEGWDDVPAAIMLCLLDESGAGAGPSYFFYPAPHEASPRTWRFDAGEIPIGAYRLHWNDGTYSTRIEVPRAGVSDVAVELPPPARLAVRFVLASNGEPVAVDDPTWHFEAGCGTIPVPMVFDLESGAWIATVPVGPITVDASGASFQMNWLTFDVRAGVNEFEFPMTRGNIIRCSLVEGGVSRPWPRSCVLAAMAIDGEGRRVGGSFDEDHYAVILSAPGRYRLELQGLLPGYEPVPPFEIDVPAETIVDHPIELVRRP